MQFMLNSFMVKLEVVSTVADIHYGSLWIIMDHYVLMDINGINGM